MDERNGPICNPVWRALSRVSELTLNLHRGRSYTKLLTLPEAIGLVFDKVLELGSAAQKARLFLAFTLRTDGQQANLYKLAGLPEHL